MRLGEKGFSSFIPRGTNYSDHSKYSDDNCSYDSFLPNDGHKDYNRVDSYIFLPDTDTFTPMDTPQGFNDEYYSYMDDIYINSTMVLILPL